MDWGWPETPRAAKTVLPGGEVGRSASHEMEIVGLERAMSVGEDLPVCMPTKHCQALKAEESMRPEVKKQTRRTRVPHRRLRSSFMYALNDSAR